MSNSHASLTLLVYDVYHGNYTFPSQLTMGDKNGGHVAIDDVEFHNCALKDRAPGTCSFEHGTCGYKEYIYDDEYNWLLQQGPTPSYYTGPKADHTYGESTYLIFWR